ncbi:hypothetical protein [Petrotoga sp. 9PWA.NaAc.5.4]|nr:hypothetical protein [Petrotoga sp. 9PWA.NaAc.5.4]PNR97189.1 hypothetical protein X924_00270 [Petrotoga sp. 9PWA.NaAc.5.4]
MKYEVRKALMEDEMAKFLDKERRKRQFERFIENGEIILIGIYNNG